MVKKYEKKILETERDEYPYSLTEKGRIAWNNIQNKNSNRNN